jgi:hypothetical protein
MAVLSLAHKLLRGRHLHRIAFAKPSAASISLYAALGRAGRAEDSIICICLESLPSKRRAGKAMILAACAIAAL